MNDHAAQIGSASSPFCRMTAQLYFLLLIVYVALIFGFLFTNSVTKYLYSLLQSVSHGFACVVDLSGRIIIIVRNAAHEHHGSDELFYIS